MKPESGSRRDGALDHVERLVEVARCSTSE
jgi:hypothetical protein